MAQRSKTVVGLDIDPTGITAAQVGSGGRMSVDRCASMALEPGIVRDGEIVDVDALSDALKALYRANKNLDRRVRVGLANQKIVVRTIEMPLIKDRKELAAAVRFQAADELRCRSTRPFWTGSPSRSSRARAASASASSSSQPAAT